MVNELMTDLNTNYKRFKTWMLIILGCAIVQSILAFSL